MFSIREVFLSVVLSLAILAVGCGADPLPTIEETPAEMITQTLHAAAAPSGMVAVAAGQFTMGCDPSHDAVCTPVSVPSHSVKLAAYAIDRTEVTQSAYQGCIAAGVCTPPAANFAPAHTPQLPVRDVTFAQAAAFCTWQGRRLPTEAEWERAARGTDLRPFPWGKQSPTCKRADYAGCPVALAPVGQLPDGASPCGALDMAGSVYEWTADWFDSRYYAVSPVTDPKGPASGVYRAVRGGSYASHSADLDMSLRIQGDPASAYDDFGFRCAFSMGL